MWLTSPEDWRSGGAVVDWRSGRAVVDWRSGGIGVLEFGHGAGGLEFGQGLVDCMDVGRGWWIGCWGVGGQEVGRG